jgi:hypothetical protein
MKSALFTESLLPRQTVPKKDVVHRFYLGHDVRLGHRKGLLQRHEGPEMALMAGEDRSKIEAAGY